MSNFTNYSSIIVSLPNLPMDRTVLVFFFFLVEKKKNKKHVFQLKINIKIPKNKTYEFH